MPGLSGKTLGTNNDHSSYFQFWFSSGTTNAVQSGGVGVQSATFYLWGVQLEQGSVATPLEKLDPRYDWANCCRFYQPIGASLRANAPAGGAIYECTVSFQAMRAVPTVTTANTGSVGNATSVQMFAGNTATQTRFTISSVAAGDCYSLNAVFNLSADL